MIEILENATIVYTDGVKEHFDAIHVTEDKVVTGRILNKNRKIIFKKYGLILRNNIKQIYNGSKIKIGDVKS
jgi:hypothetical protein